MSDLNNLPTKMNHEDWKNAYSQKEVPHWAKELESSPLASELLKSLPSRSKILEIGVGNGRDSIFFAQNGNQVIGIDIALGAVKLAKKNAQNLDLAEKIDFRIGNVEKMEFEDKSFDAVYSISVLHSTVLPDSISEITRVLKPGGKAILYFYEMTQNGGKKYWFYRQNQAERIFKENGLNIEDKWDFWDSRHEKETTKVMVFKLNKSTSTT